MDENKLEIEMAHIKLMRNFCEKMNETPLILKGGTSLLLCYGLNRFSEDLDFDCKHKLNLESKIRNSIPFGFKVMDIRKTKDTNSTSRYKLYYSFNGIEKSLKIEISHRSNINENYIRKINNINTLNIAGITNLKLKAAFDGDNTRKKVRDLFDLNFISNHWPVSLFDKSFNINRLYEFSKDIEELYSAYKFDYLDDPIINTITSLEDLVVEFNYAALNIKNHHEKMADFTKSVKLNENVVERELKDILANEKEKSLLELNWIEIESKLVDRCKLIGLDNKTITELAMKIPPLSMINRSNHDIFLKKLLEKKDIKEKNKKQRKFRI